MVAKDGRLSHTSKKILIEVIEDMPKSSINVTVPATAYVVPSEAVVHIPVKWTVEFPVKVSGGGCVLYAGPEERAAHYGSQMDLALNGNINWTIAYDRSLQEEEATYMYFTMCCETQLGTGCSGTSSLLMKAPDLEILVNGDQM